MCRYGVVLACGEQVHRKHAQRRLRSLMNAENFTCVDFSMILLTLPMQVVIVGDR